MKKTVSLVLSLALVLAMLIAPATSFAVEYPIPGEKTITVWKVLDGSIIEGGYSTSSDTPAVQLFEKNTGVKLELQEFNDAEAEKLAINAAGTLPDVYIMNYNSYLGGVSGMVSDGLCIAITPEMLQENAPDYWEVIKDPIYQQELVQLDGNMYMLAGHLFLNTDYDNSFRYWRGLIYRSDILEKNGLSVPTNIDEFYNVLTTLKAAGIETPLTFQGTTDLKESLVQGIFTSPFGLVNAGAYLVDGKYHYGAYEPEYREVLKFMNKLYSEGLISVDYLTMENTTVQSMMSNGQSAVMFGNNSRLSSFMFSMEEGGMLVGGPLLKAPDQERALYNFGDNMISPDDEWFITPDCADPALVMQTYNYLFTEEGNLVRNLGTFGESWDYDENGNYMYTELLTNNPEGYALDGISRCWALINWAGIHAGFQNALRMPLDTQLEAYQLWGQSDHDAHAVIHTTPLIDLVDEYANKWTDIELYINESRAKFISGELNLEEDFDNYINTLQSMGMDRVIEIMQETQDAYAAALAK